MMWGFLAATLLGSGVSALGQSVFGNKTQESTAAPSIIDTGDAAKREMARRRAAQGYASTMMTPYGARGDLQRPSVLGRTLLGGQ